MNLNTIRKITQKLGVYEKIGKIYATYYLKRKYAPIARNNHLKLEEVKKSKSVAEVKNQLPELKNKYPNSGGIPIDTETINVETLYDNMVKNESRVAGVKNYEGMALNDALALDDWKHFSFWGIANAISEITRSYTGKDHFSAMEMGSGSGTMYQFLKYLNCTEYLGLDGNPLAFNHSTYIISNPDSYQLVDLQEEINFNHTFDLVFSFEVLEHIREDKTNYFLKTIANHMGSGSIFLGTIAHSVMDVHINLHDKNWWLIEFDKVGLVPVNHHVEFEAKLASNNAYNWNKNDSHIFALRKKE